MKELLAPMDVSQSDFELFLDDSGLGDTQKSEFKNLIAGLEESGAPDPDNTDDAEEQATASRRAFRPAGPSPHSSGDNMLVETKAAVDLSGGGVVTSGSSTETSGRRATREAGAPTTASVSTTEKAATATSETTHSPQPGEVVAKKTKNGARRVYQYDENLKLRPMSQDAAKDSYLNPSTSEAVSLLNSEYVKAETLKRTADMDPRVREMIFANAAETRAKAKAADVETQKLSLVARLGKKVAAQVEKENAALSGVSESDLPEAFVAAGGNAENWKLLTPEEQANFAPQASETLINEEDASGGQSGRTKRLMGWAKRKLSGAKDAVFMSVSHPSEYLDTRNKKLTAVGLVAGAVALTGVVTWLALKNGGTPADTGVTMPGTKGGSSLGDFNSGGVAKKAAGVAEKATKLHETMKMHGGDTVWAEGTENLIRKGNSHPSLAQKVEEMHRLMTLNGISEEEARHLAVGTKLKIN
jgi:hypothetical protein